jgi:FkbH-like protein
MSEDVWTSTQAGAKAKWVAAKATWRQFHANQEISGDIPDLRIGLAATFTANTLSQFVGAHLISEGYKPNIAVGPYNQLFQVCLDPKSHFGATCDAIALLWRIEDLMGQELDAFLNRENAALARACDKLALLAGAISNLRSNFSGTVIISIPAVPTGLPVNLSSLDYATRLGHFHRTMTARFIEIVDKLQDVRPVDFDSVQREVGFAASFDPRQWYLYRQPFSDAFLHEAGIKIARIIVAARRNAKKCIVLDCDDTLWGGIIGEDGLDGIEIGAEYPGSAFRDFQRLLLHWRRQGIFIALLSKNNEDDVWEVFDKHSAMLLKRTDISAWQINWLPKADNIALIAKALSIGIDSLVFVDDNPMEISYMQQAQPEVTSILLPADPADIVSTLQRVTLFDRLEITDEDLARVDMMRAEMDREQLSAKMSKEEFLETLGLKIELFQARPDDLGRVTQLINKTNQFNLTTIRKTLDEVRALANSSNHRVYALRVSDKFGDYGLTGVLLLDISADRRVWSISNLLLSCRVLGRGVEAGLLAALARDAAAEDAVEFIATFIPTKKNALASTFLPDYGFKPDGDRWRLALKDAPELPSFVERVAGSKVAQSERAA